ncbi:hypothetical protein MAR_002143 [Mya arenaria]|uniref:Uncharacterized protein n=1 Tax=Mya arenaria TaxID=6604 RepID=A0ABY7FDS7_MYAAR|nr:uncharacterized protein LOC128208820 [Mya arenaria]WAR20305.1 hypothetical protein MAR_002143 [Mya arenaria]
MVWIELKDFKCPSADCDSRGTWLCKEDGTSMYINEKGIMECRPGTHTGKIIEWGWKCKKDCHQGEYFTADFEGFCFSLSMAIQYAGKGGSEWAISLLQELGKQYNK